MKKEILQYNSIELASDESFIAFIRHQENAAAWESWVKQHPGFQDTFAEAKKLALSPQFSSFSLSAQKKSELWNNIDTRTYTPEVETEKHGKLRKLVLWSGALSVAASLLLIFVMVDNNNLTTLNTDSTQLVYTLPDASSISLGAESTLRFQEKDFRENRSLKLDGEAFFEVEKGNEFIVNTNNGSITVLGTSFNIKTRNGKTTVACYTGKVRVSNQNQSVILTPGMVTSYTNTTAPTPTASTNLEDKPSWINGEFNYKSAPLREVMDEIERQFNVDVKDPDNLLDEDFGGSFNNRDLNNAMEEVLYPWNLTFTQSGNTITIIKVQ